MSTLSRKLVAACLVATISLVMYGCGGGGGGSSDPVDPPTTPTPSNVDLTGLSTATLTAGMHDIAAGGSYTSGDITFMCAAGGDACKLTITADGMASSTGGMVTADYSAAAKTRMAKAATDKANAISTALAGTPLAPATTNGVPVASSGSTQSASITRKTTGETTVTINVTDGSPAKYAMSSSSHPAISGWTAQSHSRTDDDAPMDSIGIYTDIMSAKPQKLTYDAGADAFTPGANNLIILDAKPKASYEADDTITGTIQGVHGTFTCATGCNAPSVYGDTATGGVNPNTVDEALTSWSFKSTNNVESAATQDADYLYFGYWMQTPKDATDAYQFVTFSGGNQEYSGNPSNLGGKKATYNGAAAGKYVKKELAVVDGSISTKSARSGMFTAKVKLDAVFGTSGTIAADLHNTISGTISEFMDGSEDLDFLIRLSGAIGSGASIDTSASNAFNAFHGTTPHNATDGGAWSGTLYGPVGADSDMPPSGVAGVFDAHFSDGNVSGGFGATR